MRKKFGLLLAGVLAIGMLSACGPAPVKPMETIAENETAFLIPMEAQGDAQKKFMSIDYLKAKRVATTRVEIPIRKRKLGRGPFNYEWVNTMKVIRVVRTPVTREWSNYRDKGTSKTKQGFSVESSDSVGFVLGGTLTARIAESDAELFLYTYAGQPLSAIVDTNVRGYLQAYLTDEFGRLTLEECKAQKGDIFIRARKAVTAYFKDFGITIDNFGPSQGLDYENPKIQQAIDDAVASSQLLTKRTNEKAAQDIKNLELKATAETELYSAQQFQKAREASETKVELEIKRMQAEAQLEMAKKWNGKLPESILPSDSPLLLNLGK